MPIFIAIADDHTLIRKGLKLLLNQFPEFIVIIEAANGLDLINSIKLTGEKPDIALIDIGMPIMDGFETAIKLKNQFNDVRIISLSVYDDINTISKMIECGANAYLLKDSSPDLVRETILEVYNKGYYYSQQVINSLMQMRVHTSNSGEKFHQNSTIQPIDTLTDREKEFIRHCCTELTYKEIADKMAVSQRTVDGYRESVFSKLDLKSRSGIVIFAFNNKMV